MKTTELKPKFYIGEKVKFVFGAQKNEVYDAIITEMFATISKKTTTFTYRVQIAAYNSSCYAEECQLHKLLEESEVHHA